MEFFTIIRVCRISSSILSIEGTTVITTRTSYPQKPEHRQQQHQNSYSSKNAKRAVETTKYGAKGMTVAEVCHGAGFSLGLNDRAQRPVVLFSALSFFLSALSFCSAPCRFSSAPCRFVQRPVVFPQSPLVSLGFHQRYFELEVAESVQLRRKVARFLCITLFASDIAAILDLRHRFRNQSEATLMAFEGMSFSQLFTWKVVRGFMNINMIQ